MTQLLWQKPGVKVDERIQRFLAGDQRAQLGPDEIGQPIHSGGIARMVCLAKFMGPRSAPEAAERWCKIGRFLHFAEEFPCLVVVTKFLRRPGLEVGDDGGLTGRLA